MGTRDQTVEAAALTAAGDSDDQSAERAFLVVYPGEGSRSRVIELPEGVEVSFGRSRGQTIMVDHEKVSRAHAKVVRRGAEITISDLGSRNGTRVNGQKIDGPTRLSSGDEIAIGPAVAVVGASTSLRRRTLIGSTSSLEERLAAEVDRAVRYKRPLGLIMVRIDGAAPATEAAVERLAGALRRMDFVAEYGPDELAVVVPEADRSAAEGTARRLARAARAAGIGHGGIAVHVGLSALPGDGTQAGELLSRARAALRAARSGGGEEGVATPPREAPAESAELVVVDPQMRRLFELISRIADTSMTVLVQGETGAGKELVAEALHARSTRRAAPLVKLNCASLPETLLESELFGYERGAFTGADRKKLGYFEAASGGTLMLDELGEMPLSLQAKLLRALERRVITRVGGTQEVAVDVRVVAASNRNLEQEVARGRFREDLFFRVSAFTLVVPPLRDRPAEITPLAEHFVRRFARELGQAPPELSPQAKSLLLRHVWPGNVRELRNAIERAVVLQTAGVIGPEHLPERVREAPGATGSRSALVPVGESVDVREHLAEVERAAIVAALESVGHNQTRAAEKLGLSRRALIYKMEKYGLKAAPGGVK
jgi:DNA-binding NtrC family response regulator/pSer/pThr/pTyr-binding forkhead associated (FHA) protein